MDKHKLCAHMARHFADSDLRLTREDAREFLSELQRVCQRELAEVGRFKLTGIGTLVVRERKSRMARHPVTGKPVLRPGHRVVMMRPGKMLRDAVARPR